MKKINTNIINLGCRLNIFEGEIIKTHINNNNLKDYKIINSCAVTEQAEKKVRYEIRRLRKNFPDKKIVVTGCAAQLNPEIYANIKEVDFIVGNKEKLLNSTWSNLNKNTPIQVKNIFDDNFISSEIVNKFDGKSRAYVEIQQGCDHRCTFCIIPFARGNNRSAPAGVIIDRIKTSSDFI